MLYQNRPDLHIFVKIDKMQNVSANQ